MKRYERCTRCRADALQIGDIVYNDQDGYVRVVAIHRVDDSTGNKCTIMWESSTGRLFPLPPTADVSVRYQEVTS